MRSRRLLAVLLGLLGLLTTQTLAVPSASATYSGHNGRIVFGMVTDAGRQLFSISPRGGVPRQLTHVTGDASFPDWSPQGRLIAFDVQTAEGCSVMLMRASGTRLRDLTRGRPGCEENPAFTPDGRHLVFVAQRCEACPEGIWRMDLSGHHRRLLTPSPAGMHSKDPNISPNGRLLGFVAEDESNMAGVFVMALPGGRMHEIVPRRYDVSRKLDWSPHGHRILFSDNANELDLPANIMTVRPDGSGLRRLTHFADATTRAFAGSYSPDGRWVVARLEAPGGFTLVRLRIRSGASRVILRSVDAAPTGSDWGATLREGCN